MNLSCCIWALTEPDEAILPKIVNLGLTTIDIQPHMLISAAAQALCQTLKLQVACIAASFDMPAGAALDSPDEAARAAAVDHLKRAFTHGASLGATTAYIVPGIDDSPAALARLGQSLLAGADAAAAKGLKLCVEHFPGRALPTAAGTLDYLADLGHPNLYLLFDIGHVQMSQEDPAATIKMAADRLGYVHLDDNDGVGDLHWSLLDGMMTEESLLQLFNTLNEIGYTGPVSLELSPKLPDPLSALARSIGIVQSLM